MLTTTTTQQCAELGVERETDRARGGALSWPSCLASAFVRRFENRRAHTCLLTFCLAPNCVVHTSFLSCVCHIADFACCASFELGSFVSHSLTHSLTPQ